MKNNSTNIKIKYTESKNYQKHFKLNDRIMIQKIITENRNEDGFLKIMLKDIGNMMENDPSTISKEVKLHRIRVSRRVYSSLSCHNALCQKYSTCQIASYINSLGKPCYKKLLGECINNCPDFEEQICPNLKKFPWVCNGCPKIKGCRLNKYFYYSDQADKDYRDKLVESRKGINLTPDEFKELDHIVSENVIHKGQPIYHICVSNDLPVCERTLYNYFEKGYFKAKNIDLRRKVSYKKRQSNTEEKKLKKRIKIGRTFEDFQEYVSTHNDASIVQMDTVISAGDCKKVLLTFHFIKYHFQLAYLLENKEAISVNTCINNICDSISVENFKKLFEVILTDNGTEFSNPEGIEINPQTGELRSKVFFCHPYNSGEKGHCEKNHEYIRYVLPKGTIFDFLSQEKCDLMMSHINSTKRPSVNGTPYDFMALTIGTKMMDLLKIKKIDPKEILLKPSLLK